LNAGTQVPEADNPQVKPGAQPEPIHNTNHLQGQHVLPQVIAHLRMRNKQFEGTLSRKSL
jgi:hypothetical protein